MPVKKNNSKEVQKTRKTFTAQMQCLKIKIFFGAPWKREVRAENKILIGEHLDKQLLRRCGGK
jgi:hypothetical protein